MNDETLLRSKLTIESILHRLYSIITVSYISMYFSTSPLLSAATAIAIQHQRENRVRLLKRRRCCFYKWLRCFGGIFTEQQFLKDVYRRLFEIPSVPAIGSGNVLLRIHAPNLCL